MTHLETSVPCRHPAMNKANQTAVYKEPTVYEETDTKTTKPTTASAPDVSAHELESKGTYVLHFCYSISFI